MRMLRASWLYGLLLATILALAWQLQSSVLINGDVAWLLRASAELMAGGTYRNDFFEINPPLILYLYAPVVFLSKQLALTHFDALKLSVFALSLLTLGLASYFSKLIFTASEFAVNHLFNLCVAMVLLIMPYYDLGQREHLLVIFTIPYYLLLCTRLSGHKIHPLLLVAIGVYASLGFALKPYFLCAPLLTELYFMLRMKSRLAWLRTETITIAVFLLCYLLFVSWRHPDYLAVVLPSAQAFYYQPYQRAALVLMAQPMALYSGFIVTLYLILRRQNPSPGLSAILCLAIIGNLAAYGIQGTPWPYHLLPSYYLALLLLPLLLATLVQSRLPLSAWLFIGLLAVEIILYLYYFDDKLKFIYCFPKLFYTLMWVLFGTLLYLINAKHYQGILALSVPLVLCIRLAFPNPYMTPWHLSHCVLTLVVMLVLFARVIPGAARSQLHPIAVAVVAMILLAHPFDDLRLAYNLEARKKIELGSLMTFIKDTMANKTVYYIANPAATILPALDAAGARPIGRTEDIGWLANLLQHSAQGDQRYAGLEQFHVAMMVDDISRHQPAFVLIDTETKKAAIPDLRFDYLTYLLHDSGFQQAWRHYRYLTTIQEKHLYRYAVYQRVSPE
jgi:hypothetical protein